jgi:hypothetical protein
VRHAARAAERSGQPVTAARSRRTGRERRLARRRPARGLALPALALLALALLGLALLTLIGTAGSTVAAARPVRPKIVWPYRAPVSGAVIFSVKGISRSAREIVVTVSGRRLWRGVARRRRSMVINTRRLRNGAHFLQLRVLYGGSRSVRVRKKIVVRNRRAVIAHTAGADVGVFGPPAAGRSGPSVALFNRETYLYRTTWSPAAEADRYQFMVLAEGDHAAIPLLKAINPNLKFLLYQAIWFTNSDDDQSMRTATGCTAYGEDISSHPDWILHDQDGNLVRGRGRTDLYALDVGNRGYQAQCASNAAALARSYGFDGVFFDLVDGGLGRDVNQGISIPEYPTQQSWEDAMNGALAYLGATLRAEGLLVFGNVSGADSRATWEQWVGHLDGVEEESWTDGGQGLTEQLPFWSTKFSELKWAAANGKYEFVHSYNGGEQANVFGLGAMLLAASGRASYATSNTNYSSDENWFPEYDVAEDLGAPAGPYAVLANGVYERAFARGIVLVNPTGHRVPEFSLGAHSYSGSGLTNARSVALGPTSAVILRESG